MSVNETKVTVVTDPESNVTTVQESVTVVSQQTSNKITHVNGGIPGEPGRDGVDADLSCISGGYF